MLKNLFFFMLAVILITGCSKLEKSKKLYQKGEFNHAKMILERIVRSQKNPEAEKYLGLAEGAIKLGEADTLIAQSKLDQALKLIDEARLYDSTSAIYKKVVDKAVNIAVYTAANELLPKNQTGKAVERMEHVLKYGVRQKEIYPLLGKALYKQKGMYSWQVVHAWEKAKELDPENADVKTHMEKIESVLGPFLGAFMSYVQALLDKDYDAWIAMQHPDCLKEMKSGLKKLRSEGSNEYKNLKDYFLKVESQEPVVQNSPNGPEIGGIDILGPDRVTVHFTYPKWIGYNKINIVRSGKKFLFQCDKGSEMRKNP